jgi:starch-binding outer membrane protein, SusD/RagB family
MKHLFRILVLVPLLVAPMACDDKLDIDPRQSLSPDEALSTESDLVGLLIGAYDGLQSVWLYGGDVQMMADMWANRYYLRFRGTFQGLSHIASVTGATNPILTDNGWATGIWRTAYSTINTCNLVLENLDISEGAIRNKNWVQGEALFIRGSLYFELARLYGKTWDDGNNSTNLAVPLILTSTPFDVDGLTDANYPARSSVQAVYNQAKADLELAATLLPTANSYYATRWAAYAQLSRIALMQADYAAARDYANTVINGASATLHPLSDPFASLWLNYINFGGVAPKEYVFYIRITPQDGTNDLNTFYGQARASVAGSAGRGDLDVQLPFRNLFEAGDKRGTFAANYTAGASGFIAGSSGRTLTLKHIDRFGHVPVIRMAEMYLTRAEGNFMEGTIVGASPLADINVIRTRAGLDNLNDVTLDDIKRERILELAHEGHYLHDVKRWRGNMPGANNTTGQVPWNSNSLIFPVPQREMDVNKNLVQNPGYGD